MFQFNTKTFYEYIKYYFKILNFFCLVVYETLHRLHYRNNIIIMNQEFQIHLKILNYFNFDKTRPKKQRNFIKKFHIFNLLVHLYCLFTQISFITKNYNNVFEISECVSPLATLSMTLAKFYILCTYCYKFFEMIEDIKLLNEKCEYYMTSTNFFKKFKNSKIFLIFLKNFKKIKNLLNFC